MITYEADKLLDPHQNLANAIVAQACDDYRKALRGKKIDGHSPRYTINDLRKFFHSEYFRLLTKVEGKYLIERLEAEYEAEKGGTER